MTKRMLYIFLLAFLILGLIFLSAGVWQGYRVASFLDGAERTVGNIVQVDVVQGSGARLTDALVQFQTASGSLIEFRTGGDSAAYRVGEQLPVVYRPEYPEQARVNRLFDLWFTPFVFVLMGIGFSLLPLLYARAVWRQGHAAPVVHHPRRKPKLPS